MPRLILDSHVHLHPPVKLERFLHTAWRNLRGAAKASEEDVCLLCLTDMEGTDSPELLRAHAGPDWSLEERDGAFLARGSDGARLWLLPGHQIASSDGLELLALDCSTRIPDRSLPLEALIPRVLELGAVPVVPWGVGKWTGTRGLLVKALVQSRKDFCLADNGNRLRGSAEPPLLREARRLEMPVLLGSDPLPLEKAYIRAAACGNVVEGITMEGLSPAALLREALKRPEALVPYGSLAHPMNFVASQVAMQLRKRLG